MKSRRPIESRGRSPDQHLVGAVENERAVRQPGQGVVEGLVSKEVLGLLRSVTSRTLATKALHRNDYRGDRL